MTPAHTLTASIFFPYILVFLQGGGGVGDVVRASVNCFRLRGS